MVKTIISGPPRNFPTKPSMPVAPGLTYPSDLFAPIGNGETNNFYTSIRIKTFRARQPTGPAINLPIPRKINDVQVLTWSQESTTAVAASLGVNALNFWVGSAAGVIINPALFLQFKHPNFKSFEMMWTFVADNEQESNTIADIINNLKFYSSPTRANFLAMTYPDVFFIKLHPEPKFTFKIKPCIIEAIAADYTGGDIPAFYKNGAPVAVNMTIRFKEIEIWEKNSWDANTDGDV
jgi:hypothetical protein